MDWEAEYARYYGGPPRPEQPWHQVLALMRRTGRFDVRDLLRVMDGTALGRPPTTDGLLGQYELFRAKLNRLAYESQD